MAKRNYVHTPRHTVVVWVMGLGLVAMLGAAGSYFVQNPGLTSHSAPSGAVASGETSGGGASGGQAMPGQPDEANSAVMALMQKLQANPNDSATLLALAQHFLHTEQVERAENFAMRAVMAAQGADAALPLYFLGMAQHSQQRYPEAAQSLEKSLALRDDADTRFGLGILYRYFLKDEARGVAELKKALESPGATDSLRAHVAAELEKKP